MAAVEDVLQNRLELLGLSQWSNDFSAAANAVGVLDGRLNKSQATLLSYGAAAGAAAVGGAVTLAHWMREGAAEATSYTTAVRNLKGSMTTQELEDFAGELSRITGVDDGKIADIAGILGTFGVGGEGVRQLSESILNAEVALRALGVRAPEVANAVGKALESGDASGLRRTGIIIDTAGFKAASAAERVRLLQEALNRQGGAKAAVEFLKTYEGQLQRTNTELGNFREGVGGQLLDTGAGVLNGINDALAAVNGMGDGAFRTIATGAVVGTAALGALSLALLGSTIRAGLLAGQNAKLLNESLKAAKGTDRLEKEEEQAARAMGGATSAATVLTGRLGSLTTAHDAAAAAARRHADAENRLGHGTGGGYGTTTYGGTPPPSQRGPQKGPQPRTGVGATEVATATAAAAAAAAKARKGAPTAVKGDVTLPPIRPQDKMPSPAVTPPTSSAGKVAKVAQTAGRLARNGAVQVGTQMAADYGLSFLPDEGPTGVTKRLAQRTLEGASLGRIFGPIGALGGGALGFGKGVYDEWQNVEASRQAGAMPGAGADSVATQLEETNRLLAKQNEILGKMSPIGYDRVSRYDQGAELLRTLG